MMVKLVVISQGSLKTRVITNNYAYSEGLMPPRLTSTSPSETIDSVTFSSPSPTKKKMHIVEFLVTGTLNTVLLLKGPPIIFV